MDDDHRPPLMTRLRRILLGDRPAPRARWSDGGPGELFAPSWDTPFDDPPSEPVELDREEIPWELRDERSGAAPAADGTRPADAGAADPEQPAPEQLTPEQLAPVQPDADQPDSDLADPRRQA